MDRIKLAIQQLGIDPAIVVKSREEEFDVVILADYGGGGIKKHRIPIAQLLAPVTKPEPEPKPKPTPTRRGRPRKRSGS